MKISAISISDRKGIRKKNINETLLIAEFGLENDAHGGAWHRQVSFLAEESIESMRQKGLDVVAGNFAENITTTGIDLTKLPVGTHLSMGKAEVIISQLGKVCHNKCAIYHQAGDCVMPREGIFAVVKQGGRIRVGDVISILSSRSDAAAIVTSKSVQKEAGEVLLDIVRRNFSPGFIRFDTLNSAEDNLAEILADLTGFQKVAKIIVLDTSKKHPLAMLDYQQDSSKPSFYIRDSSQIIYCRSASELEELLNQK